MGKFTKVQTQLIVKDVTLPKDITAQLIIGTPGRVLDLIKANSIQTDHIKVFVLDEADLMIDEQGLGDQSIRIKAKLPKNAQVLLFSATYKDEVKSFADRFVPKPAISIQLKRSELTLDGIQQLFIDCKSEENKFKILSDIYGYLSIGQSIIFVHTRKVAQELTSRMAQEGHIVGLIYGGEMTSAQRDQAIKDFREGKIKVLITTNVLARGIDILQVMLVINYDVPLDGNNKPDPETYLHRIGRSGRFGRKGIAINFIHDIISKNNIFAIQKYFNKPISEFPAEKIENLQAMLQQVQKENEESRRLQEAADKLQNK